MTLDFDENALMQKARQSLEAAEVLLGKDFFDFAVSRAYYSMFYVAEAMLLSEDQSYSKHAAVISAFGQRFAKTGRVPVELHRWLIEAQSKRSAGDYEAPSALTREDAELHISQAKDFLKMGDLFFLK
jgi:uncharacterized protein (UPF0332 family)